MSSCPTCPSEPETTLYESASDESIIENRPQVAEWLEKMGETSNIPYEHLPDLTKLEKYTLRTRFPEGLRVYLFASASHEEESESPELAYQDYQNSTVAEVGPNGLLTFWLERPGSYCLGRDDTCYPAHLHLVPESLSRPGTWSAKLYTYVIQRP